MFWKIQTKRFILFVVLITASLSLPSGTLAQSETPNDLVNAVNSLRASHGLEPYQIDPWLMAYAQEHSEYMAALQTGTHQHRDGTLPQDIGLQENVAGGDDGVVTVAIVVYEIWVDWGHRHTLIGYPTGIIGAGIASAENGQIYYTVDIRPAEDSITSTISPVTPALEPPLETSVPSEDGSIIHIVNHGETLWGIAQSYGVTVDDIRRLNGIAGDSTLIHPGQKLLIRPANTIPPFQSEETSSEPTQPLIDTAVPFTESIQPTEFVVRSPMFTVMPTKTPSGSSQENKGVSWGAVLTMGIFGLLLAAIFGLRKLRTNKMIDDQE